MANLIVGVVRQPAVGHSACGDAYCVVDNGPGFLAAVVDGLGHGPDAEEAALTAISVIRAGADLPVDQLILACHAALRRTRGAVVGVARVDGQAGALTYAGVGNIEARLVGAEKVYRPVGVRGIVGQTLAPRIGVERYPYQAGDLLVMHSDGISDRFVLTPASRGRDPQQIATQLAFEHGKHHDDQLVLAIGQEPPA